MGLPSFELMTDQFLNDIATIPTSTKNLLSINKFCSDNYVIMVFNSQRVNIMDKQLGRPILEGKSRRGLYELPLGRCVPDGGSISTLEHTSLDTWHRHLAHLNHAGLKSLALTEQICVSNPGEGTVL